MCASIYGHVLATKTALVILERCVITASSSSWPAVAPQETNGPHRKGVRKEPGAYSACREIQATEKS